MLKRGQRRPIKNTDYHLPVEQKPRVRGRVRYSARAPKEARKKGIHGHISSPDGIDTHQHVQINSADYIIKIATELRKHGVNVPHITHRNGEQLTFEDAGPTIDSVVGKIGGREYPSKGRGTEPTGRTRISKILSAYARQLGKIHALGYLHGHPHSENFAVKGNKVSVIDLKDIKKHNIDWSNANEIYRTFSNDYNFLLLGGKGLAVFEESMRIYVYTRGIGGEKFKQKETFRFLSRLISRYPTNDKVKKEVLAKILEQHLN